MSQAQRTRIALAALFLITALTVPAAAQTCNEDAATIYAAMEAVAALDVPVEGALLVELASAMTGLATGDADGVVSDLESFINKVESSVPQHIDAATAAELIAMAESVLNRGRCPCADPWVDFMAAYQPIGDASYFGTSLTVVSYPDFPRTGKLGIATGAVPSDTGLVCFSKGVLVPETTLPLDAQGQIDACQALLTGYAADLNCPPAGGTCSP